MRSWFLTSEPFPGGGGKQFTAKKFYSCVSFSSLNKLRKGNSCHLRKGALRRNSTSLCYLFLKTCSMGMRNQAFLTVTHCHVIEFYIWKCFAFKMPGNADQGIQCTAWRFSRVSWNAVWVPLSPYLHSSTFQFILKLQFYTQLSYYDHSGC